jgi:hypothetical protein
MAFPVKAVVHSGGRKTSPDFSRMPYSMVFLEYPRSSVENPSLSATPSKNSSKTAGLLI